MKIQMLPIGILLGALVTTMLIGMFVDLSTSYSNTINMSGMERTASAVQNITITAETMYDNFTNFIPSDEGAGFNIPYKLLNQGFSIGRTMWQSVILAHNMIADLFDLVGGPLGIPSQVAGVLAAILMLTIAAIFIFAVFKWKWES